MCSSDLGTADMAPLPHPVADCISIAKRDLAAGETMGRIGERDYRAWAMTTVEARLANGVPLGLVEGARILKPVKAGAYLTYDNCRPDEALLVTQIRRRLDQADAGAGAPALASQLP